MDQAGTGGEQAKWQMQRPRGLWGQQEVGIAGAEGPTGRLAQKARGWRKDASVRMALGHGLDSTRGTQDTHPFLLNMGEKTQIPRL